MRKQPPQNLDEAFAPIVETLDASNVVTDQALFLSCAGVSLGVLLVAVQIAGPSPTLLLQVVVGCSGFALPIWLALWQVDTTHILWRGHGLQHSKKTKIIVAKLVAMLCGAFPLYGAVLLLVLAVSKVAAACFFVVSLFSLLAACWHAHVVRKYVEAAEEAADS